MKSLQQKIRDFAVSRNWERFHTPRNLASAISIEAAELLELYQWDFVGPKPSVGEELADIAIYVLRMADVCGIDLEAAIELKMEANAIRYPADECASEAARGVYRKRPSDGTAQSPPPSAPPPERTPSG